MRFTIGRAETEKVPGRIEPEQPGTPAHPRKRAVPYFGDLRTLSQSQNSEAPPEKIYEIQKVIQRSL